MIKKIKLLRNENYKKTKANNPKKVKTTNKKLEEQNVKERRTK